MCECGWEETHATDEEAEAAAVAHREENWND